jgi:hypothetical protein
MNSGLPNVFHFGKIADNRNMHPRIQKGLKLCEAFHSAYGKRIGMILFISLVLLGPETQAGEDDSRNDSGGLYLYPHEAIRKEELQILDSETRLELDDATGIAAPWSEENVDPNDGVAEPGVSGEIQPDPTGPDEDSNADSDEDSNSETGPKSLDRQIREAEGLLKRYYSQFLSEKRIWEDKNRGSQYGSRSDQNEVRLLLDEMKHKWTESNLVRDSEIIHFLHKRLGRLYTEKEQIDAAIRHYRAAIRYRNFTNTETAFLNQNVWKEVLRDSDLEKRQVHLQTKLDWEKAREEELEAKREIDRLGSEFAKGKIQRSDYLERKKSLEVVYDTKKSQTKEKESIYQDSIQKNFEPVKKEKAREDAEMVYNLSKLIKKVEDQNKERLKIINKSAFAGRGIFVLFDYKRNTDFFATEYFLELAYKLDPEFRPVLRDISAQYKLDGRKEKAIDFYQKYIQLMEREFGSDLPEEEKEAAAEVYLNLAILNADLKRTVIAAKFYDKYLELSLDDEKKTSLFYELGRFYEKHIGNPEVSAEYYDRWLGSEPENQIEKESIAHYGISLKHKKTQKTKEEEGRLLLAYDKFSQMKRKLEDKERELIELERDINRFKRELLLTTQDDALAEFRLLQLRYDDEKLERDQIKARYSIIPASRILFRLGELREKQRDFEKSKEYYREIIDLGSEYEVKQALGAIRRVEKTQSDGFIRK